MNNLKDKKFYILFKIRSGSTVLYVDQHMHLPISLLHTYIHTHVARRIYFPTDNSGYLKE